MSEVRLIDANALMKRVCEKECGPHFNIVLCDLDDDSTDTRCVFREYVRSEPTVEAEPVRHGRWDEIQCFSEHGIEMASYECTSCGYDIERQRGLVPPYCEFCGAKMDATDTSVGGKVGADNG